jgi:membrane protein DedA with SNARE-associated domain
VFSAIEERLIPLLEQMYAAIGYPGLAAIVAFENIFFFLPVPSEVVLPLAGWMVGRGVAEPLTGAPWSFPIAVASATLGSLVGALVLYAVSAAGARPLLERYGRFVLIDAHDLEVADRWFARYGDLAVLIARVVPIARSAISIPAGISRMPLGRFILFTVAGSLPWNIALIGGGVLLGNSWEHVREWVQPLEYVAYALVLALIALFLWRQLRVRRDRA